ncbi:hypothetical protein FRX31_019087, partial [Thalictrum thalictroides]
MPTSRQRTQFAQQMAIIKTLRENSSISSTQRKTPALKKSKYGGVDYDPYIIYYLESTLTKIYYKYVDSNPSNHVSKSCYFSYIPGNFKKAKKKTDACKICLLYDQLKAQETALNSVIAYHTAHNNQAKIFKAQATLNKVHKKFRTVEGHILVKEQQHKQFNLDANITSSKYCVVLADFKENISLCQGPIETMHEYCRHQQISVLGFAVIYLHNGNKKIDYYNYFSEVLNHDSLFAGNCLTKLLSDANLTCFDNINIWTNGGAHFWSKEFIAFISSNIRPKIT